MPWSWTRQMDTRVSSSWLGWQVDVHRQLCFFIRLYVLAIASIKFALNWVFPSTVYLAIPYVSNSVTLPKTCIQKQFLLAPSTTWSRLLYRWLTAELVNNLWPIHYPTQIPIHTDPDKFENASKFSLICPSVYNTTTFRPSKMTVFENALWSAEGRINSLLK